MPRKVLLVAPLPPPAGGIATWARILVARGLPKDFEPVVVDSSVADGTAVFGDRRVWPEVRRSLRILGRFLGRLLFDRPAVVHVNVDALAPGFWRDAVCVLLARSARVPSVVHYHGLVSLLEDQPERWLQRAAVREIARRASLNLVLNEPSLRFIRSLSGGRSRVVALPLHFDERSLPARDVEPRGKEPLRVAFVAGLTRRKGIAEVVEIARLNPDVRFAVVGRSYPETESILRSAPPNLEALGEVSHEDALEEMARSHVLLFPTRHGEGFPNVVCEAMALGLAVISTAVGAIPEMVEDHRGGRILAPDVAEMSRAIRALDEDEALRVRMGLYNREKAQRLYEYPRVAERMVALYEACISPAPPGLESERVEGSQV